MMTPQNIFAQRAGIPQPQMQSVPPQNQMARPGMPVQGVPMQGMPAQVMPGQMPVQMQPQNNLRRMLSY